MAAGKVVLMVLGIVALVAAINLAVWIPIVRRMRRMPGRLRDELDAAGEHIVLGPERGNYRGATSRYGRTNGIGVIALTTTRLAFRKAIGSPVDVPCDHIAGVRFETRFLSAAVAGRQHLVITLDDGVEVGYYVGDDTHWFDSLKATIAARHPQGPA